LYVTNDTLKWANKNRSPFAFLPSVSFGIVHIIALSSSFSIAQNNYYSNLVSDYFNEIRILGLSWYHLTIIVSILLGIWTIRLRADDTKDLKNVHPVSQ
jgi:hypothetical protein